MKVTITDERVGVIQSIEFDLKDFIDDEKENWPDMTEEEQREGAIDELKAAVMISIDDTQKNKGDQT